ncbi:hypothetical protein SPRG_19913 [Saprolegnia parasitica CBS 223.65]|uniref:DDRGK domain-containing protein 1 n=1 Tax=Saprolegnia parasitica (strain CBS 223.65) TaxID=695850 RepID=A0A067CR30_SAPPC|nr:hypothetical protein SPRG_19913 [Saprolegnia parasitica CBS 223.65]KDO29247.1 hypothetical protein SPRG_19913 [Saprolegnia parasitica CBS 223.65]|eukprot:XP_012200140.1 hypothetical protein SPRG_19913 [Saprolegnia parasitica CBS 223.65]
MQTTDAGLLAVAAIGLAATMAWILYMVGYFGHAEKIMDNDAGQGRQHRRQQQQLGLDGLRQRRRQARNDDEGGSSDEEAEDEQGDRQRPPPTTRREIRKEQKRQEREQQRKFDEYRREEARKLNDAQANAYRRKMLDEATREEAEAMAAAEAANAQAARDATEFAKWKGHFSVEDAGSDGVELSESTHLLSEFLAYLATHKVVLIEDLALRFQLSTTTTMQRLQSLLDAGRVSGFFDDRGKFIAVDDTDMDHVARYIRKKGRVSVADVLRECNRLFAH